MPDLATFQLAFATAMGRTGRRGALEKQPGFAVYRNTSHDALNGALRGHYPVVAEILGEEGFSQLAHAFARLHPPADPVLIGYGAGFADFLAGQIELADLPYLAGVAALERLRTEAHIAADAPVLGWDDLSGLEPEALAALRLPLHPACGIAWLTTPAVTIWQAHRDGFETLEPEWRSEGALVTRPAGEVALLPIDAPEHRMLFGLRLRESAGEAAAATAATYPRADIAQIFAKLVNAGAFARPPSLERTQ